jgi:SM-20-related protein
MTDIHAALGILTIDDFVPADLLSRMLGELGSASSTSAEVYTSAAGDNVDAQVRSTKRLDVSDETRAVVVDRLMAAKPTLQDHFGVALSACERPQFLHYQEGDFFQMHADSMSATGVDEAIGKRLLSLIVFLNGRESYAGGALAFLTQLKAAGESLLPLPYVARAGSLVAFRSHLPHEVRPVTSGHRYTIVSWFL